MVGLVLLAAAPAAGDTEDAWPRDDQWVPSIAVISGVSMQIWSASISTDCRDPDPMAMPPLALTSCNPSRPFNDPDPIDVGPFGALGEPDASNDRNVTPFVGGSLQLMSPVMKVLPGRPRLFFGGELPYNFGTDRDVAGFRNPSTLEEPRTFAPSFADESLQGVGSRVRAKLDGLSYGASAGLAFPFEVFGRRLRLKISGGWFHQEIDLDVLSLYGLCPPVFGVGDNRNTIVNGCDVDGVAPTSGGQPTDGFTREIRLQQKDKLELDGVGPGVELEMDTGRVGPLGVSLFAGFQGFYVLGDRRISSTVRDTVGPDNLRKNNADPVTLAPLPLGPAVNYGTEWSYSVSPWIYRGTVGVRFHWVGWPQGG